MYPERAVWHPTPAPPAHYCSILKHRAYLSYIPGSEPQKSLVVGAAGTPCALGLAGMAAYPQQPVTVGSRPERLEMRSLATSSAQVGWMPTVRITCS